jgi:ATP-binding cassette subfamily B multidrug efflux pump
MESYRWLWRYLRRHALLILIALLLVLAASVLNMIGPFLSGAIVDRVIVGRQTGLLKSLVSVMIAAVLVKSIVRYVFQMSFEHASQDAIFSIRSDLYSHLQGLDFAYFDRTKTGDIMARMTGDMDAVRHFAAWVVYMIFENAAIFLFSVVCLFSINWKLAAVLFALAPMVGLFTRGLARSVRPTFQAIREQFSRLNSVVQENISGNRVVKAFSRESFETEKFDRENEAFRDRNLDSAKVWGLYIPIIDSLSGSFGIVQIVAGGIFVIRGWITIGQLVTFSSFTWALINPMRIAGWLVNDVQRFHASAEKIRALQGVTSRLPVAAKPLERKIRGEVEMRGVSFTYGDEPVLSDVSFRVPAGGTVGIMGPTGSGKSTIAHLLSRFYDATSGQVLIDGVPVERYDLGCLRSQVGIAMQDVFLFSDTIEGNVAYGDPLAPMEKVKEAAGLADAEGFIRELPDGYDTIVGERGVGLSGGQKQRLSLARLLLKDPPIVILDDTTCSVDVETEHRIQEALAPFKRGRTAFIISHRVSSVENADVILVVSDGRIVERGTHAELVAQGGYYGKVYAHQTGQRYMGRPGGADADTDDGQSSASAG